MDKLLPPQAGMPLRFAGDGTEQALLTTLSALVDNATSHGVKVRITGTASEDSQAHVLFLSLPGALSTISDLLKLINENSPGAAPRWLAVSMPGRQSKSTGAAEIQVSGSRVQPAGSLVVQEKSRKVASFVLYPLPQRRDSPAVLQPAKVKLPEPKGNLRARGEWFQSRRGRR